MTYSLFAMDFQTSWINKYKLTLALLLSEASHGEYYSRTGQREEHEGDGTAVTHGSRGAAWCFGRELQVPARLGDGAPARRNLQ
jgi:hypothetical protein